MSTEEAPNLNKQPITAKVIDKMEKSSEFQLNNLPSDYISAIKFPATSNQLLLVSSWDCTVRLYDTDENSLKFKWMHKEPILDCLFMVTTNCF